MKGMLWPKYIQLLVYSSIMLLSTDSWVIQSQNQNMSTVNTNWIIWFRDIVLQYSGSPIYFTSNNGTKHVISYYKAAIVARPVSYTHLDVYKRQV